MSGPARVFISYSNVDTAIVDRVRAALTQAGVAVWLDHEQLTPGTSDWRAAVLRGIEQATTVIYAASPDAAASKYVGHELAIAEGEGRMILPFWIRGEKWYFCAPMGLYFAQHIDGRDAAYASGLAKLLDTLSVAKAAPTAPKDVPPVELSPYAMVLRRGAQRQLITDSIAKGNYQRALTECEAVLQYDPTDAQAWAWKAMALRGLGRNRDALMAISAATKLGYRVHRPSDPTG